MLPSKVTMCRPVLEFLHVARHPIASECCLKDLGYNGMPTDFIAGCRQDRRVKDNVLTEGATAAGRSPVSNAAVSLLFVIALTPRLWKRVTYAVIPSMSARGRFCCESRR
jgi:hypothetical protein